MKKILLALLALCALPGFAQIEKLATFDFEHYETLSPTVDMGEYSVVSIVNTTFVSGSVTMKSTVGTTGVQTSINQNAGGPGVCALTIPRGAKIIFNCSSDSELLSIDMRSMGFADGTGGLTMSPSVGTLTFGVWECNGTDGVRSISFTNGTAKDVVISGIKVTYRAPQDTFKYLSVTPANNASVTEFDGFTFNFAEDVTVKTNATFYLKKAGSINGSKLIPSVSGKVLTLTPESPVTEAATYSLTVDKGFFIAPDGTYNKEFTTSFTLKDKEDTFIYTTINPEQGDVEEIPSTINIAYPDLIGHVSEDYLTLKNVNGETIRRVEATRNANSNYKSVDLTFTNEMGPVTEPGVYTIEVPAKFIYNNDYNDRAADKGVSQGARYNPAFTIQYKVGGADLPSEETINKAKALLKLTGIGYPTANALERTALQELVRKAEQEFVGSDAEMLAAIDNYLACTDIEMPVAGKYYTLANVEANASRTKRYIQYADGAATLTKSEADAASLLVEEHDGKLALKTADGKYLHSLVDSKRYSMVTPSNVTDAYNAEVNDLSFVPLAVDNLDAETTFGLFSMYGYLGKKNGADKYAYSLVNTADEAIETDDSGDRYFGNGYSSAFVFAETTSPDPETIVTLSPINQAVVKELNTISVTIEGVNSIAYDNSKTITITSSTGAIKVATNVKVNGNTATFNTGITDNGTYSVVIPKGTFTYFSEDHTVLVPEIKATYTVASDDVFNYDFDVQYHLYTSILDDKSYRAEDMNSLSLYTTDTEFFINEGINHSYVINYDKLTPVCDGTLTKHSTYTSEYKDVFYRDNERMGVIDRYSDGIYFLVNGDKYRFDASRDKVVNEEIRSYTYFLDFKFDMTFNASNMPNARYCFGIDKGSYGDSNFGRYLQNSTIVAKKDCHLNARGLYYFNVDNSATGISEITVGKQNIRKFIKNGKMVIVKDGKNYNAAGQTIE